MAEVTVEPETFTMVDFDAGRIAELASELADAIGLEADLPVLVEVDERSPLGRATVESHDPPHISVESGAFEDPKVTRALGEDGCRGVIGRLLLKVQDRRSGGFDGAPPDEELPLPHAVAWSCYAAGRMARLGYRPQRQRWLYHFRNRHGFTDAADAVFARIWDADALTWDELVELSDRAAAANPAG